MLEIGYALSSEEHRPGDLVRFAAGAEASGFRFALISDHFHPWTDAQGQSSFVWAVLGGIARATERLRLGTGVTCPTVRIHPAIIAQAAATVAVRDHGGGLDDDALAHVFDRFWQADHARVGHGAGLGLAIVAGIAAEHAGTATAANVPGGGAMFTLRLPLDPTSA